jgi:hypothetical protein
LNHPNFYIPINGRTVYTATPTAASTTPLATAGAINNAFDPRKVQVALKLVF